MGYIYKIINKQNGHSYVGQTRISIDSRWKRHCLVSRYPNNEEYNFALHRAIRKYGESNFLIIQIEECPNEQLDEREIYWISYYDTYNHGYNEDKGGRGSWKYNYDDIVNYYLSHNFSIKDTCIHFNIYDQVVYSALKSKNIDYRTLNQKSHGKKVGKKIMLVEKNLIFNSMTDIDKYFGKQVHGNIRRCLNGVTKKAYGYTWKELEE